MTLDLRAYPTLGVIRGLGKLILRFGLIGGLLIKNGLIDFR